MAGIVWEVGVRADKDGLYGENSKRKREALVAPVGM